MLLYYVMSHTAEVLCYSLDITPIKRVVFVARTKPTGAITGLLEKGAIS